MVQSEHGAPDVLRFEERPEPALCDTDVPVRVHATSVNPIDTKVRAKATVPREWPLILGFDVRGTVVGFAARAAQWHANRPHRRQGVRDRAGVGIIARC